MASWTPWVCALVSAAVPAARAAERCALPSAVDDPAALWRAALGEVPCAELAARELGFRFALDATLAVRISTALAEPETRSRAARALIGAAACARDPTWLRAALELLALPVAAGEQEELRRQVRQAVLAADCAALGGEPVERPRWLLELAGHPEEEVALLAIALLGSLRPTGDVALGLLRELETAETPRQTAALLEALAQAGAAPAVPRAERALTDESPAIRHAAIALLAAVGPRAMVAAGALARVARADRDATVRRAAREALAVIRGDAIEGPLRSRLCLRALRPPVNVCCEPVCPRWADLGTRAALELDLGRVAAVGVLPAGEGPRAGPPTSSAVALAIATWRRFVRELLQGGVDALLREGAVANRSWAQRRVERDLGVFEDWDRRARAEAAVDELVRELTPEVLAVAGERAALVGLSLDALGERLRATPPGRRRTAAALADFLDRLRGRPVAPVELPAWVRAGTGWQHDAQGAYFRALGAAYAEEPRFGQGAADRRALDLLILEVASFADALVAEGGARPGWRELLVSEAPAFVARGGQIIERWHDADDGRFYALAELDLSDYLTSMAGALVVPPGLRRYAERHAARVFARAPTAAALPAATVRPRAPAAVGDGRIWPIDGRLTGAVAIDRQGRVWAAGAREQEDGLWRVTAAGELTWRRRPGGWAALAVSPAGDDLGEVVLLAAAEGREVTIAGLGEDGEPRWQAPVPWSAGTAVDGLWPGRGGIWLAVSDRGGVRLAERRAALVRLGPGGARGWTYEVTGRGETIIAGVVEQPDGGVVLLADARLCLDPQADPGCGADPFCEWNVAHSRCGWNKALVRLSRTGQRVWERHLKLEGRSAALLARADGGFVLLTAGRGEASLAKLDARGLLAWQRLLRLPLVATPSVHLCALAEEELLLVGTTPSGDLLTARIDGAGVVAEQIAYGGRGRDVGLLCVAGESGATVIGESDSLDLDGAAAEIDNGLYRIEWRRVTEAAR